LQPGLEQACFRCGGWHVLVLSDDGSGHLHARKYLYIDCPGRGPYPAGRYFAGQVGTESVYRVREADSVTQPRE
jgi:hypothetical protein